MLFKCAFRQMDSMFQVEIKMAMVFDIILHMIFIFNKYEHLVWFWDWKSTKNYRTFKAHDKVCTGVSWHPIEPSKFATCGWDGTLRYWD